MIFTDRFLFLHLPKTAGKSLTTAVIRSWGGTVTAHISRGQIPEVAPHIRDGSELHIHTSHQNVPRAQELLKEKYRRQIEDFEGVFIGVRSPYTLFFSTYFHLRKGYELGKNLRPQAKLAAECDTPLEFARKVSPPNFEDWMTLDGETLMPNLRMVRFEQMQKDLDTHAKEFGYKRTRVPHLNEGVVKSYDGLMSPEIEELIFQKYNFFFERGIYQRQEAPTQAQA